MAASLTFLAPAGALVCLAAVVPFVAALLAGRRTREVARSIGLRPASARSQALRVSALAAAVILLGLAVARPALRTEETREARTDAQAFFVFDVSRSMRARSGPTAPTRLERAREAALRLRAAVDSVPSGAASLTDRVLPYVFPTSNERVFRSVVTRSVTVETPPPREVRSLATTFDALADLPRRSFFARDAKVRLCVVLTDGETRSFSSSEVGAALLASPRCRLVVVRVGGAGDRIYDDTGRPEAQYRPQEDAGAAVEALAAAAGGNAFTEDDVDSAADTLRSLAGQGPTRSVGVETSTTELAPYLALVACAAILVLVLGPLVLERFVAIRNDPRYDRARGHDSSPDAFTDAGGAGSRRSAARVRARRVGWERGRAER
jgi:hypothetical protein